MEIPSNCHHRISSLIIFFQQVGLEIEGPNGIVECTISVSLVLPISKLRLLREVSDLGWYSSTKVRGSNTRILRKWFFRGFFSTNRKEVFSGEYGTPITSIASSLKSGLVNNVPGTLGHIPGSLLAKESKADFPYEAHCTEAQSQFLLTAAPLSRASDQEKSPTWLSDLKINQYPAAVISVKITGDGRDSGLLTRVTAVIYGCSPGSGLCAGTSQTSCLSDRTTLASVCQDCGIFSFINISFICLPI